MSLLPYQTPKKDIDQAIVLNTPVAASSVLATGTITLINDDASTALAVKVSDIVGYKKVAYSAGVANAVNVTLTNAVLVANGMYSMTIVAPNVVIKESGAVYQTRTYTVSVDATPTVAELLALFVAAVNADAYGTATASSPGGNVVRLTSDSAFYGQIIVSTNVEGATIASQTAYVAPSGTPTEIDGYTSPSVSSLAAGHYTRYLLRYRKAVNHNAIAGLMAFKVVDVYVYAETTDINTAADYSAFATALDAQLGGTATAATYLGAVAL